MQISLIEFSIENFKTFKNKAIFSMVGRKSNYTFETNGENLLKASLIYGPNASGKSSLLGAFNIIRGGILFSANTADDFDTIATLPHEPFLGALDSATKPSFFEVIFSLTGTSFDAVYKYTFSILSDHIVNESLVECLSNGDEKKHLERKGNDIIKISSLFGDSAKILSVRKGTLFISIAAQINDPFALVMIEAFKKINVISGVHADGYKDFTIKEFKENKNFKEKILQYLNTADFCIREGHVEEVDVQEAGSINKPSLAKRIKRKLILFLDHPIFNKNMESVGTFKVSLEDESDGTISFINILGPVLDTLESGKILFIDEFDNSLHPLLTKFIVDLFDSEEVNKNNAQLVATTHDTSLLSYKDDFIKDQFWFTSKDEFGAAKLFSLAEFNLRNDTEFARKYLEGRFGGLPFIGSIKK